MTPKLHLSIRACSRAVVAFAVLSTACGSPRAEPSTSTTAPTSPSATMSDPRAATYRVSGLVVDGAGLPVPGVALNANAERGSTITDAGGAYDMTVELLQPTVFISLQKAGYEPSHHAVGVVSDRATVRNLRLHAIQSITAGESLPLAILPDDPGCGFDLAPCRRVRVRSPTRGTLRVDLLPQGVERDFSVAGADEDEPTFGRRSLAMPVGAGEERAFDVVYWWGSDYPAVVTLRSTVEAPGGQ